MSPGPRDSEDREVILHASCVALDGRGVLILGASGAGKSALALQLMAFGARLVSDDRTLVRRDGARLVASSAPEIGGLIEARGVGLLQAEAQASAELVLAVDLDREETSRLPDVRSRACLGIALPLVHKVEAAHFPAAILQYLKGGPSG